jgi:hypothetical protein
MNYIEILSLILSGIVLFVAAFAAVINYLNYKAITSFSLYFRTDTKSQVVTANSLCCLPNRITNTLELNGLLPIKPVNSLVIRWFDLTLGNTGPGLVRNIRWKVGYSTESEPQDKDDMCSREPFDLGPQSNLVIVGYLPRDYALINEDKPPYYEPFKQLPNFEKGFPWKLILSYEIPRGIRQNLKVKEQHTISPDGIVRGTIDDRTRNKNRKTQNRTK